MLPIQKASFDRSVDPYAGLDYGEFRAEMHLHRRAVFRNRRCEPPEWALNDSQLRRVLLWFWARRIFQGRFKKYWERVQRQDLSDDDQLRFCQEELPRRIAEYSARLKTLCQRFVAREDPRQRRALQTQIRVVDSNIRVLQRGPGLLLRVIVLYYRCGFDSVAVAQETGFSPQFCRQVTHRLGSAANALGLEN